jgi:hypothetical protein
MLITSAALVACSVAPSTGTFQTAMAATLTALPSSTPNPTSRPEPTPFPTKVLFNESYTIDLDPAAPASVIYADDLGVRSQLDFPAGSSSAAAMVTLIPELASSPDPGLVPTGHAFILLVSTAGQLDKSFVFERPVTITLTYDEGALIQEQSLQFLWWSGEQWQDPGSSCAPALAAEWQPQTNTIRAATCSPGAYALFTGP